MNDSFSGTNDERDEDGMGADTACRKHCVPRFSMVPLDESLNKSTNRFGSVASDEVIKGLRPEYFEVFVLKEMFMCTKDCHVII